ncbi:MAG: endolytic transglycosylase MltG, partial [Gemmatimonadetes bacterium]|nr:endolytic transglycosylase MltG [Gemmatimonadota bacterium]
FPGVAQLLAEKGLVRAAKPFVYYARYREADRSVKAGWYEIPATFTPAEVLSLLVDGPNLYDRITLPEGLWLGESISLLAAGLQLDSLVLDSLARSPDFQAAMELPGPTLEGYLYPETYHFGRGVDEPAVLAHLAGQFRAFWNGTRRARAEELGMSVAAITTLASIVEAEAVVDEERVRIAAVFHNRLERGMLLQADPTVQYARGNRKKLYYRHLEIDSPYNTYRYGGLPPSPICSPGAAAMQATLYPLEGCEDLYFVATRDGSGRHAFSRTIREHNRAREEAARQSKSP